MEGPVPSTAGTARQGAATPWSTGDRTEGNIKNLLLSQEEAQEKLLLGFAKMNRSPPADRARQLQIPTSKNHTRRQLIRIIREDFMQQATPKCSTIWASASTKPRRTKRCCNGPRTRPLGRTSGGSAIPLEAQEVRVMAEDAKWTP